VTDSDIALSDSRTALLHEITQRGVTHASGDRRILSRDGQNFTGWVMSFLGVGLREPWLSTACDLLLDELKAFGTARLRIAGGARVSRAGDLRCL